MGFSMDKPAELGVVPHPFQESSMRNLVHVRCHKSTGIKTSDSPFPAHFFNIPHKYEIFPNMQPINKQVY